MNDKSSVVNNEVKKTKVIYAKINERVIQNQSYFEILYKEVGKDYECVGYGSFSLSTVQEWLKEYFEIVGEQEKKTKMTGNEYQKLSMRTNDGKCTDRLCGLIDRIADYNSGTRIGKHVEAVDVGGVVNGLFGLSGEAGELTDMIKKWIFHNKTLDITHAQKELGDVMWYVAMICESFGWSLDEIMQMNIDKLKKRYPDGFDTERANNRSPEDV